jgi:hypothetical protein
LARIDLKLRSVLARMTEAEEVRTDAQQKEYVEQA